MACRFEVIFPSRYSGRLDRIHASLDLIQALERQMTVFRSDSEIMSINRSAWTGPVAVERRLFDLFRRAHQLFEETGGAFDMTSGPLTRCWGFHRRQGRVPGEEELAHARAAVGSGRIRFEPEECTVRFTSPELELNLGGIGKGYALDRAVEALTRDGIQNLLFHGGYSSCVARGDAPLEETGEGWPIAIRDPRDHSRGLAIIYLRNAALGISGSGEQYFEVGGRRLSHLIDPRSGRPAEGKLLVVVRAPSGADADALSTAFFVMSLSEIEAFCRDHPGLATFVVPNPRPGQPLSPFQTGFQAGELEVQL